MGMRMIWRVGSDRRPGRLLRECRLDSIEGVEEGE